MKIGKISPTIWNRSVKKKVHIGQTDDGVFRADTVVCGDHAGLGYYAVLGAVGELASHKVTAKGVSVNILFPEKMEEAALAALCEEIQKGCEDVGVILTALSAEGTAVVKSPVIYASAGGKAEEITDKREERSYGDRELVLCGYAGLEGSLRILEEAEEELSLRFVNTFLAQAKQLRNRLVVPKQILAAADGSNTVIRQIGSGGILAELWRLAEDEKIGFEIAMGAVLLKQETVEICEYYRLNPYQMTSAGSYLILTDEAERVIEVLEKAGARAVRLGVAKAQNARVITSRDEIRYLDRPAPDELARWQKEKQAG